jgi:hypothetical protein
MRLRYKRPGGRATIDVTIIFIWTAVMVAALGDLAALRAKVEAEEYASNVRDQLGPTTLGADAETRPFRPSSPHSILF